MDKSEKTGVKAGSGRDSSDRIIRTDYSELMQKNYIDYAMSVITLDSARDATSFRNFPIPLPIIV